MCCFSCRKKTKISDNGKNYNTLTPNSSNNNIIETIEESIITHTKEVVIDIGKDIVIHGENTIVKIADCTIKHTEDTIVKITDDILEHAEDTIVKIVDDKLNNIENNIIQIAQTYNNCKNEIIEFINQNKFIELLKYVDYEIKDMITNNLLLKIPFDIIEHILKHLIDYDTILEDGKNIVQWLCVHTTEHLVKFFIEFMKDKLNLEHEDNKKWKLIHYVCKHNSNNMIKYMVDKNVCLNNEVEDETNNKWHPLHHIFKHSTYSIIKHIIKKYPHDNIKKHHFKLLKDNTNMTHNHKLKLKKHINKVFN